MQNAVALKFAYINIPYNDHVHHLININKTKFYYIIQYFSIKFPCLDCVYAAISPFIDCGNFATVYICLIFSEL
jgi:hypothetical protein